MNTTSEKRRNKPRQALPFWRGPLAYFPVLRWAVPASRPGISTPDSLLANRLPYIAATQKLREVIEAYGSSLGTSEEGKAWCIKALHPSDPLTEVRGIPDRSSGCSVMLNFQQQVTLSPPASAAGKWNCEINVLPDPLQPVFAYNTDTGAAHAEAANLVNTQFGVTTGAATTEWLASFEQWRLVYMGASIYLNASDLYNEGICTAAQHSIHPLESGVSLGTGAGTATYCTAKIQQWQTTDDPPYDVLVRMPAVYTGEAREGCYMPLRLDSNHQRWRDSRDVARTGYFAQAYGTDSGTFPAAALPVIGVAGWPYADCQPAYLSAAQAGQIFGDRHLCMLNDTAGKAIFTGLNLQATVTVMMRWGVECRVLPSSKYSSFQALAPPYDPISENTYFAVSRQLKDAYPVSYNDFGKLWDVIKSVARTVDPFLGLIPGGAIVRQVGQGIGSMVDMVRKPAEPGKGPKGPPNQPSPAQVEAATQKAAALFRAKPRINVARAGTAAAAKMIKKAKAKRS